MTVVQPTAAPSAKVPSRGNRISCRNINLRHLTRQVVIRYVGGLIVIASSILTPQTLAVDTALDGRVRYENDSSPVSGLRIRLLGRVKEGPGHLEKSRIIDQRVTTDKGGRFEIRNLVPGEYNVYIERKPDAEWTHRNLKNLNIVQGHNETVELSLIKGKMLLGKVVDFNGTPVTAATVDIESRDVHFRTTSDAKGMFSVHVPTGEYRVEVRNAPKQYSEISSVSWMDMMSRYGPDVLVSVATNKIPLPVNFTFYAAATPGAKPIAKADPITSLLEITTRHIVAWAVDGTRMPGVQKDYGDKQILRKYEHFVVVCDYLPRDLQISKDPRVELISRSEYAITRKKYGYIKALYLTIDWVETAAAGDRLGFEVTHDTGYYAKSWFEVIFTITKDGITTKVQCVGGS